MLSLGSVDENLHFLILEVIRQVERTRVYLRNPSEKTHQVIVRGDDYIDHLRTIIQRKCFALARELDHDDRFDIELLKSLDLITANLERIADFCESIVGQFLYLETPESIDKLRVEQNFDQIVRGLEAIEPALQNREVHAALDICRIESRLDDLHADTFREVLGRLDGGSDAQTEVTILFMSHYFERMGDAMLNIGEAILSAAVGERIKIDQFRALRETVEDSDAFEDDVSPGVLSVEALGETRSGCRIDRVSDRSSDEERMVVFKEGPPEKLLEEKKCVDRWNELLPGYAPQIYSFQHREDSGAILFEYLPGRTFEELVLRSQPEQLAEALARLQDSLREIWTRTREDRPIRPGFIRQIANRIEGVYELHPEFRIGNVSFGGLQVVPFDELIERVARLDDLLEAPFSVLGHGDLNVDNVIYDDSHGTIRFIDLHRSRTMDYVHDLSVFLVSHYRLQVFELPARRRIQDVIAAMHDFAAGFAEDVGDKTFGVRLAAGLARSFTTSARFVLDEEFAKNLFFRGRYLIEQLAAQTDETIRDYAAPGDILLD